MQFTPKGIYTAIVTPFTDADEFDEIAFRKLIDFQIASGAAGLLVIGGSGEFVSLTPSERQRVIDVAIDQTTSRIPIIVGALAPGTREVQDTARYAAKAGASAVLVLPSYYIKASPEGIHEHFARVADSASIPIVAYNNSGRTGITLDVTMLEKLAKIPSIVALKECERDLAVVAAKISAVGDRIAIMSGDDDLGFPTFLLGSPGGIFMSANLVPEFHRKLFDATMRSDLTSCPRRALCVAAVDRGSLHREPSGSAQGRNGPHRPSCRHGARTTAKGKCREPETRRGRAASPRRYIVRLGQGTRVRRRPSRA